jgi:hypothetical protein
MKLHRPVRPSPQDDWLAAVSILSEMAENDAIEGHLAKRMMSTHPDRRFDGPHRVWPLDPERGDSPTAGRGEQDNPAFTFHGRRHGAAACDIRFWNSREAEARGLSSL